MSTKSSIASNGRGKMIITVTENQSISSCSTGMAPPGSGCQECLENHHRQRGTTPMGNSASEGIYTPFSENQSKTSNLSE